MSALQAGSTASDFTLCDARGESHSLSEARAKGPVLLTFFKIACPTCQYALPFFGRLSKRLGSGPFTVWAISQDSAEHTALFNQEFEVDLPQLFDSEDNGYRVSDAYGISYVPATFLVEPDGAISCSSQGWSKDDFEQITARLAEAAGQPVFSVFEPSENVPAYRPGCSSKN